MEESTSETGTTELNLSIFIDIISTENYDKQDDFDFDIVNCLSSDGVVPRNKSYSIYISQIFFFFFFFFFFFSKTEVLVS